MWTIEADCVFLTANTGTPLLRKRTQPLQMRIFFFFFFFLTTNSGTHFCIYCLVIFPGQSWHSEKKRKFVSSRGKWNCALRPLGGANLRLNRPQLSLNKQKNPWADSVDWRYLQDVLKKRNIFCLDWRGWTNSRSPEKGVISVQLPTNIGTFSHCPLLPCVCCCCALLSNRCLPASVSGWEK